MPSKQLYRQCRMEKPTEKGKLVHTAWIPSQFAKAGKVISLKNKDETWSGGWTVVSAGTSTKTVEDMDIQRDAQKRWESVLK